MAKITVAKAAGLKTAPNKLTMPEGSATTATNVLIRGKNIYEPRRGFQIEANGPGGSSDRVKAFTYYDGGKVSFYTGGGSDKLAYSTGGAYTDYSGTYTPPDAATLRMKFAELNENLYFTTSLGIKGTTALATTPSAAGLVYPNSVSSSTNYGSGLSGTVGADTWLPANSQVAYRAVLGIKDANNNVKLSAPSGRFVVINPADIVVPAGSVSRTSNVVTVTYSNHGFSVGDYVRLSPTDVTFTSGTDYQITATTASTFTYAHTAADATSSVDLTFSSGTKLTNIYVYWPSTALTTDHFLRIYRSDYTTAASIAPDDELFMIYEGRLTATEVSNGFVNYVDRTPVVALGDPLYTNPRTGEGILQANYVPPLAKDMCAWNERLWFANTKQRQSYDLQMLGIGSPDGVQDGDLICIGTTAYRFKTTPTDAGDVYLHTVSGSISKNIQVTAFGFTNSTDYVNDAYYLEYASGDDDPPGKLRITSTVFGASAFGVGATRPASWNPQSTQAFVLSAGARAGSTVTLTTGSNHGFTAGQTVVLAVQAGSDSAYNDSNYAVGTKTIVSTPTATTFTYTESGTTAAMLEAARHYVYRPLEQSTDDAQVHGVYYSKFQEPEAVPLLNYVYVGARNKAILRIAPLRDRLYVFKEDGLYTITGQAPNLRVDEFDSTCRLVAPDSVVAVNNSLFALTTKGVVVINEAGVGIISDDIRDIVDTALSPAVLAVTKVQTWGASYESEGLYLLGLNQSSSDTAPTSMYVYNTAHRVWAKWDISKWFAAVDPVTDKLCISAAGTQYSANERKAYDYTDYVGELEIAVTINAVSGTTITLASTSGLAAGYVLVRAGVKSVIVSVDSGTVVTVKESVAFGTGSATVYTGYPVTVEYAPQFAGAPSLAKHFSHLTLHFNKANINSYTATFRTEQSTSSSTPTLTTTGFSTGAAPTTLVNVPIIIPLEKQRGDYCHIGISVQEAYAVWQLNGYTLDAEVGDDGAAR